MKKSILAPGLVAVIFILLKISVHMNRSIFTNGERAYLALILLQMLIFLLPAIFYCKLRPAGFTDQLKIRLLTPDKIPITVLSALLLLFGTAIIKLLLSYFGVVQESYSLYSYSLPEGSSGFLSGLYAITVFAVIPAITEEFVFRGVLQAEYEDRGIILSILMPSLLFSMPPECIDVTIHRQSIVHSMIETEEGAVYALMSPPDMTLPIITAIVGEGNGAGHLVGKLPFSSSFSLSFEKWDPVRFPLLSLAYEAARKGGGLRIAYTAADETAVNAFLSSRIMFTDIAAVVERVMEDLPDYPEPSSFEEISEIAELAKRTAEALC